LIGALILASLGARQIRGRLWAVSNLLVPVMWILFSWVTNLALSLVLIGVVGLFIIMTVNLTNAMVQTQVEDSLRGRVMGIYTTIFFGLTPVGSLLAGFLAERVGEQWTVTISGIALLAVAVFSWFKMPYLRKLG